MSWGQPGWENVLGRAGLGECPVASQAGAPTCYTGVDEYHHQNGAPTCYTGVDEYHHQNETNLRKSTI